MQKNAKTMGGRTKGMLLCIGEICSYNVFEHSVISIFFPVFIEKRYTEDMQWTVYVYTIYEVRENQSVCTGLFGI